MPYDGDTFLAGLAVYVALRNEKGGVFMLRRTNAKWKNGYYSLPAGRVEKGETFVQGAIRELKEEAGVTVKPDNLKLYSVITRQDISPCPDWVDLFFTATRWEGEPRINEPHKFDHAAWFSIDQLTTVKLIENQMDGLKNIGGQEISHRHINYLEQA